MLILAFIACIFIFSFLLIIIFKQQVSDWDENWETQQDILFYPRGKSFNKKQRNDVEFHTLPQVALGSPWESLPDPQKNLETLIISPRRNHIKQERQNENKRTNVYIRHPHKDTIPCRPPTFLSCDQVHAIDESCLGAHLYDTNPG